MKRKYLFFLILFILFLPKISFAENVEIKQKDEDELLRLIDKGIYNQWENITLSNDFSIEEQAILIILYRNIQFKILNSILREVGKESLKWTLRVAALVLEPKIATVIGEFENLTVEAAKNYAMDWLLQNQIKTGNGNLNFSYKTVDGKIQSGIFPYIIVYKPVGADFGEVAMDIYSAKTIKAPEQNLMYEWEGGIEKIPPFILQIKGRVAKTDLGAYRWTEGPEFTFIFNQPVPKFDFKEPTFIDEVKLQLDKIGKLIETAFDFTKGSVKKTAITIKSVWDSITGFLSNIRFFGSSSLADAPVLSQKDSSLVGITIDFSEQYQKLKNSAINFLESLQKNNQPKPVFADNQDEIDDLKEEIDILIQKIADLQKIAENMKSEIQNNSEVKEDVIIAEEPKVQVIFSAPDLLRQRTYGGGGGGETSVPFYCQINNTDSPLLNKVIFGSIGWTGNDQSANNEWIELKNLTGEKISLSGWQVLDKDLQIKTLFPSNKEIEPNHIFLMERTDDNSVLDKSADFIYTGALNNDDEILYLFDSSCVLQDKVTNIITDSSPAAQNDSILSAESESSGETINIGEDEEDTESILDVESESDEETVNPDEPETVKNILINEIAWMGTEASTSDEWIELYNSSEGPVELAGWNLLFYPAGKTDPSIDIKFSALETATPTIEALGYFLLERTNDNSVKGTKSDYIYKGDLNNEGGIIELKDDNGNVVDKADFSAGWPAGKNDGKISMERYNQNTWKSNNLLVHNSYDANENYIYGTPRAKNSVVQIGIEILPLPFDKFGEIVLPFSSSPYFIGYSEITVPGSKTLTIEPGVEIKFLNNIGRIVVGGTLKAVGTEENKITFTSAKENPAPGDWRQIYFKETSKDSELSNIILEYGGADPAATGCSDRMAGIRVENASIYLTNSVIKNNLKAGVFLANSLSGISGNRFLDNPPCPIPGREDYGGYGLEASGEGSFTLKNSYFSGHNAGIYLSGSFDPVIEGNIFEGNKKAISSYRSSSLFFQNTAQNNDLNGIYIFGSGGILQPAEWKNDLPYFVSGMLNVIQSASLAIDAGVIVKFIDSYSGIKADGTLIINGEKGNEVLFTSAKEVPAPGDWDKIEITPTSQNSEINYAIIEYAGGRTLSGSSCSSEMMAGLKITGANVAVNNITIRNTQYQGVYLIDYPSVLNNPIFENIIQCLGSGGYNITIENTSEPAEP